MTTTRAFVILLWALLVGGCAGFNKSCSQQMASSLGADWIVVQYDMTGRPFHCWKLTNVAVDSQVGGNVDWQDGRGHLVHLTGWENRVQVNRGDFEGAAATVGVDASKCGNGVYPKFEGGR